MKPQKNYIDERGNYHNVENLTLTQIHDRASEEGYRLGKAEALAATNNLTQGEWLLLRTNYEDSGNNFYECSICHYSDIHAGSAEVPFCWHCGAKMKGGQAVQQNETK